MGGGSVAKAPLPRTFHSTDEFLRVRPFRLAWSTDGSRSELDSASCAQTTPNWLNHKESFGFYDSDTRFELKQWLERHHQSAIIGAARCLFRRSILLSRIDWDFRSSLRLESKEIAKIGVPPKALKECTQV